MEPYILTQADIDDLLSRGFNMRDVSEGDEAMPAEVQALGMAAPTAAPADAPVMDPIQMEYSAARAAGVASESAPQEDPVAAMGGMPATAAALAAAPAVAAAPTAAYGGANMMDLLSQPISQDPFENLSRRQRTMLGFAALQDAGLALQGKQGSAFSNTLAGFRERADMERKRQVALARQQMLGRLTGGTMNREQVINAMMMGAIDGPTGTAMLANIDRAEKQSMSTEGKAASAANQLDTMREILEKVEADPFMTTGPVAMFLRNVPISKAGQTQALVDSLRSTLALDTLKDLKATGATMGALNREELNILLDDVTKLDLALGPEAVRNSLYKIDKRYKNIVRGLYSGANEEDTAKLDAHFGGRPSWLDPTAEAADPLGIR